MLTIWALGASSETIQIQHSREALIHSFHDKEAFMACMHREEHYPNYLAFFQRAIAEKGVPDVINEYLFSGDDLAESLLSRMFAGLLHPIIHLAFGIEFRQPAIIAQALAQAAVHQGYLAGDFYEPVAAAAAATAGEGNSGGKSLLGIMDEMRGDQKLRDGARHEDTDVFADGILRRAGAEVIRYCSQWTVAEDEISEKLVEMITTASKFPALFPFKSNLHFLPSSCFSKPTLFPFP
jgi:hypothetical protein